ncbi:MAG: MerR family transcriptional regulator [Chloroflexota bacterium]
MATMLTIGKLARELALNPKTIRYYEEIGLLPEPRRGETGYRLYSRDEVERLVLVRRAKLLGLSLVEIKEIVDYAIGGRCGDLGGRLLSLVEAKLQEIDRKIEDLIAFRDNLRQYHSDLSRRVKSGGRRESRRPAPASCRCLGAEADGLGKRSSTSPISLPPGPGVGHL